MFLSKKIKLIHISIVLSLIVASQFALPAFADQPNIVDPWGNSTIKSNIQDLTGLGEKDPRSTAAMLINIALGFLGIIAVGLILFAGFKWMTAGGNEDAIGDAKKMLVAGIIGLIIILSAFAIASFVLRSLIRATT